MWKTDGGSYAVSVVEERAPGGVGTAGKYGVTPQGKGGGGKESRNLFAVCKCSLKWNYSTF